MALEMLLEDQALRRQCGRYNQLRIKAYDQAVVNKQMQDIYMDMKNGSNICGQKNI